MLPFSFYYHWQDVPDQLLGAVLDEFAANGVEYMVFSHIWGRRIVDEPEFFPRLCSRLKDAGLKLAGVHGLWGQAFDLNCPDRARRDGLVAAHKLFMNYAADAGCRTYTLHVGAYDWVFNRTPLEVLRPLALDTLEKLLPEAEKLEMVLAVENSFEPPNTPDEVAALIEHFDSPWIGCCFDSGHANLMAPFPGKERGKYCESIARAWGDALVEYSGALERLAPHIVTCHLHDNDGYRDGHCLPGTGRVNWPELVGKLAGLPRLLSLQSEAAPADTAVARICRAYREQLPSLVQLK